MVAVAPVALAAVSYPVAAAAPLAAVVLLRSPECGSLSSSFVSLYLCRVFSDFYRPITIHGFRYVYCIRLPSAFV